MDAHLLDQLARNQHGLVTRGSLRAAGQTLRQVRGAVHRSELIPLADGVYAVAGSPRTDRQRLLAACFDVGGVASHTSAAHLHGLGNWETGQPPEVITLRTRSARKPSALATVHTTTSLGPEDLIEVDGIPCTTVARTIMLLAGAPGADPAQMEALVDEAIRLGKASDGWLWWRLEHLRRSGRNGVRVLETVLGQRAGAGPTESWLEREVLRVLAAHGLPLPRCQVRIEHRGAFVARVDFTYDEQRLVIEVNGHRFHASREQLTADAARRAALVLSGHRVLDFTYDQIVRSPGQVAAMVAEALGHPLAA